MRTIKLNKQCRKCLEIKKISDFAPKRRYCKKCYKNMQHNFYLLNKTKFWPYIKRGELNL